MHNELGGFEVKRGKGLKPEDHGILRIALRISQEM